MQALPKGHALIKGVGCMVQIVIRDMAHGAQQAGTGGVKKHRRLVSKKNTEGLGI